MSNAEPIAKPAALSEALQQAFLEQSGELLAMTDPQGCLLWANECFLRQVAHAGQAVRLEDCAAQGPAGEATRRMIAAAGRSDTMASALIELRSHDEVTLKLEARARHVSGRTLWTFADRTAEHFLADQARRQGEWLAAAQEFGRIGTFERQIPSGNGSWDRYVFDFWGIDPASGTPNYAEAVDRIHPDDRQKMRYLESTQEAGRYAARYRVLHPDGATRWIHSQWEVKNGPDGRPERSIGIMMDDTLAYESARELVHVHTQLKLAVDLGKIAIWRHDLHTQLMHYNDRAFDVVDMPHRSGGIPIDEIRDLIHPDDLPAVIRSAELAMQGDRPVDYQARYRAFDGSYRDVLTRRAVERDAAGQPLAFTGVSLDITERVAQQRQADALAKRLEAAASAAGIGLWTTAENPPESDWNAQMFALFDHFEPPAAPSLRLWLTQSVHADDRDRIYRVIHAYAASGDGPLEMEFRTVQRDDRTRWIVMRADRDLDAVNRRRFCGIAIDVTEARQAESIRQQAAMAEREIEAKSQFLSRMSHELRTPLNAVLGFTQLLQIEAEEAGETARIAQLGHIRSAGDHLLALVNDVLDLAGLESGELLLAPQPVDLDALVGQSVTLVASLAARYGVTIDIATAPATTMTLGDPTRLRQVLINLLSNAIKYNRRGGKVVVAIEPTAGTVKLGVSDTGRGLSAAELARLFEPFTRFGADRVGIEGTGIGLTIVRALVRGMGGTIAVASTPGQGTTFEVTLPAPTGDGPGSEAPAVQTEAAALASTRQRRSGQILYIEDNPVNVLLVEELIRSVGGLELVSEATGAAGVARAEAIRPDLILVDLQLPDFDGFEVLRRLRSEPSTRAIRCVALSANALPEDIERGLAAGFTDYWTKPIDFGAFVPALNRLFPPSAG